MGIEGRTIINPLSVDHGIEPFLTINRMVEILDSTTINCSIHQNEAKHEVIYHRSPIGKPVAASAATSAMYGHLLRSIGMDDVRNRVSEPMVQTLHIPVPNHFDPPETNEEVPKVSENPEKRDGKRTV